MERGVGFKFLDAAGCTYQHGNAYAYPLPGLDEKWGPWHEHPDPAKPDGEPCGPGGWHVMRRLSATYAPEGWHPWYAQWEGLLGGDSEKVRVLRVRLRRINRYTFWRWLRLGLGNRANLEGANLRRAYLEGANLTGANLWGADLTGANIIGALGLEGYCIGIPGDFLQ